MEDTYVEFDQDTVSVQKNDENNFDDTYTVQPKLSTGRGISGEFIGDNQSAPPIVRPRSKARTKSYELAVDESASDGPAYTTENDYLPMGGSLRNANSTTLTTGKPVPAPRPKDLHKRLAYARKRVNSPEKSHIKPSITPTRKAPSPPTKPPQEIVQQYFSSKKSSQVVKEKVTVVEEQVPSGKDKSLLITINKVKDRPPSSMWYDLGDNSEDQGECSSSDDEGNKINYVEISDKDRLRPQSEYIESQIKLPTRKKSKGLGSGILDTIRSWSGGGSNKKSPRNSALSLENSSKFYSDPEFSRSARVSANERKSVVPIPQPCSPVANLELLVSSTRISIHSAIEESPTSPAPPIPPPRLSRSKRSFETEDSFEDNVFTHIPTSISSDTGLDIIAKSSRVIESNSETIRQDVSFDNTVVDKQTQKSGDTVDLSDLTSDACVPMLHPIDEDDLKLIIKQRTTLHKPIHESVPKPEEDFDSLDVFIPPIEHQNISPKNNTVVPKQVKVPKRSSKKSRHIPSVEDLDVLVHEDGSSSASGEDEYSGYIDPDQMATDDIAQVSRKISDDITPPALPLRDKSGFRFRPAVVPPSVIGEKARYSNTEDCSLCDVVYPDTALQRMPSEHHYCDITESDISAIELSSQHAPVVPLPRPRSSVLSRPNLTNGSLIIPRPVSDFDSNSDTPPLPTSLPPREAPAHLSESDLESSPERTFDFPNVPDHSTKSLRTNRPLPELPIVNVNDDSIDYEHVIEPNDFSLPDACTIPAASNNDYDMPIPLDDMPIPLDVANLDNDVSSDSESSGSESESDTSTSSSDSHEGGFGNEQTLVAGSGETTPVVESKSFLDSLIGDRASVTTLTPHTSQPNSIDYVESSSSSESNEDVYPQITTTDCSSQDYMSDPVRLRRQQAFNRDSISQQSFTSSEDSSRPASWSSFSSADYTPITSQVSSNCDLRPVSGESGLSSDMSIMSDMSGLSLADSTHGSIDSGQYDISQEEMDIQREEKRKKKLFFVAREIMTSEQTFVDVIKLLSESYRKVIAKSSEAIRVPIVPPATLNQILKHLPELQMFSQGLLLDLKQRIQNWDKDPRIADIFVKKGPFLKLYTSYIMDYDNKCAIFDEARKKHYEFDKCTTMFEASTQCYKLTLRHYMLKPVQRIPQYRLLLQDYQKYLTKDSPDYEDTKVALKIVTDVAEHANQSMKYGENLSKLLDIQNKLVGRYEIIKPGRYLIKEGLLNKVSRKEKQPRMFFLMNDVLLYTAPYTYNTYQLKNLLPLVGMRVRLPDETEHEYHNEFSIISTQRSFTVEAESQEEKDAWVSVLKEAIGENNDKRRTFVPDSKLGDPVVTANSEKADFKLGTRHPVWIPDDRVSMCMLCSAEFSLVFRRHHCRSCGQVVCLFCSDYQAPLRYLHNKPSRVCKTCYSKLKKDIRSSTTSSLGGDVKEGEDSSLGLLSLFSKSASTLRRSANKQFHRVSQLRGSFGMGNGSKPKSKALSEVSATDKSAIMSGYLKMWKDKKWVKNWYIVKGNIMYMFKGSEDTAATESTVLLGYEVRPFGYAFQGVAPVVIFELIHKGLPTIMFKTESENSRDKWMKAVRLATVAV